MLRKLFLLGLILTVTWNISGEWSINDSWTSSQPIEQPQKEITFEDNILSEVVVYDRVGRNNESFRLSWLNNTFDIELFFNATLELETRLFSLEDFETDFNVSVSYVVNRTDIIRFGWIIDNVENLTTVHNAWFKIEDSSFDYEEISIEEIDSFADLGYNITRYELPDNLVLSFEDLNDKGFIVGPCNKTATSIKGFENKTTWNLDPITYSSPTVTVIGGTGGGPLNFTDIWVADQANGWNVIINNNNTNVQYEIYANIHLGNDTVAGTTFFNDTNKHILFAGGIVSANYEHRFGVNNYAHATFGKLVNVGEKSTDDGCSFINEESSYYSKTFLADAPNGEFNFYSSTLIGAKTIDSINFNGGNIYNSIFIGRSTGITITPVSMDIYNVYLSGGYEGWHNPTTTTFDTLLSFDANIRNLYMLSRSNTIKNLYQRNSGTMFIDARGVLTQTIINGDIDSWTFTWFSSGNGSVQRQYEFDLTVVFPNNTAIQNANVTIRHYGEGGAVDYTGLTNSSGQIPTQTLTMGFYNQTGGNTIYDYNGYNINISGVINHIYEKNFTLTEKTTWILAMQDPSLKDVGLTVQQYFIGALFLFGLCGALFFLVRRKKH